MKDLFYTAIKMATTRVMFLAAFSTAAGLLLAAAFTNSALVAALAALAAFWAGEERGGQVICNECAADLVHVPAEIPERDLVG